MSAEDAARLLSDWARERDIDPAGGGGRTT
jgi:hypothetical protein